MSQFLDTVQCLESIAPTTVQYCYECSITTTQISKFIHFVFLRNILLAHVEGENPHCNRGRTTVLYCTVLYCNCELKMINLSLYFLLGLKIVIQKTHWQQCASDTEYQWRITARLDPSQLGLELPIDLLSAIEICTVTVTERISTRVFIAALRAANNLVDWS